MIAGVLAAVTVGAAAVAVGIALLLGHIVHLRTTANATLRTGTYLDATINLESKVVDAETGLRGYVITGNPLFLAPTQAAESALPAATLALEQAAEREGAYVSRATALADAARFYMTSYVPDVQREVATNPRAAQSFATTARGKQLVDGIRTQTQQLEHLISARQAARQRSAKSSANAAVTVAIVVLVVLTALTLALGGFLGWLLVGRERARERAAFLAEAGTTLDRGTTSAEALETFATLVLARGNGLLRRRGAARRGCRRARTRVRARQLRRRRPRPAGRPARGRRRVGAGSAARADPALHRHPRRDG